MPGSSDEQEVNDVAADSDSTVAPVRSWKRWLMLPLAAVLWAPGMICLQQLLGLPLAAGGLAVVAVVILPVRLKSARHVLAIGAAPFAVATVWLLLMQPRHDREWWPETSVLPDFTRDGSLVKIEGYRDFNWRSQTDYDARWRDIEVNLDDLTSLDLVIEPPDGASASWFAHTMLSFGFSDGRYVVVSVEARKESDEQYGLLAGLCREFELIYLFGSERDLMGVRAVQRKHRVFVFPIAADQKFMQSLFTDLVDTANALHTNPQFYNSISSNCTTTLVRHADSWHSKPLGLHPKTLMPAKVGELLHERGLMKTDATYSEAAAQFEWGERMREAIEGSDFSRRIRQSE
jgi:hypothetical protein